MKFIIASIIGAIIGYITNWLAIKMLFRPHEEKKFIGFRVPFTPGLIPKERGRIAKSVGETVGEHLLSNDVLIEALCSDEMQEQIRAWVENKIDDLKKEDSSIESQLKMLAGENYEPFITAVKIQAKDMIFELISNKEAKEKILHTLKDIIDRELQRDVSELLGNDYIKGLKEKVICSIKDYKNSSKFEEELIELIDKELEKLYLEERTLEEVVPESILSSIKVYIYNSRSEIAKAIGEMLTQPDIEDRLKNALSSMISSNLSPMIAMFINVDTIYGKLISALKDYLKEDESQRNIAMLIHRVFDTITKNNVKDIMKNIGSGERKEAAESIAELIGKVLLKDGIIDKLSISIEEKVKEFEKLQDIVIYFEKDYSSLLDNFLKAKIEELYKSDEFTGDINDLIYAGIDNILNKSPKLLFVKNEEKVKEFITRVVEEVYNRFVEKEASKAVKTLNLPKIVEERINSFDIDFAEKLILDIANKELNAITWLGALLGAIMGILSPILSSLTQ